MDHQKHQIIKNAICQVVYQFLPSKLTEIFENLIINKTDILKHQNVEVGRTDSNVFQYISLH